MMNEQEIRPSDGDARSKNLGKWLTGSGVMIAALLGVVALLAVIITQQSQAITALSNGVTQQRSQFEACKDKPATARGCTTPVAAEPSVIVKQGGVGPIGLTGDTGAAGPQGPQGPAGPTGPVGPAGPPGPVGASGKQGPPPGCALLSTACVGATGPPGPQGPAGPVGPAGATGDQGSVGPIGPTGPAGPQGSQGEMGPQGKPGVGISSTQCADDDTTDGSHWLITYSDGTQETSKGPCRVQVP